MNTTTANSEKAGPVVLPVDLRDYFAAKVLPAIYDDSLGGPDWRDAVANEAYQLADAMLKAREQKGGEA